MLVFGSVSWMSKLTREPELGDRARGHDSAPRPDVELGRPRQPASIGMRFSNYITPPRRPTTDFRTPFVGQNVKAGRRAFRPKW